MNVDDGRLYDCKSDAYQELSTSEREALTAVPNYLNREARRALGGNGCTQVDLDADSKLAQWAQKKRARRDLEAIVRRANRKWPLGAERGVDNDHTSRRNP